MSESAPSIPQQEPQVLSLTTLPREFTVSDVANVQNYLQELHSNSMVNDVDLIPGKTGFYEKLTEGANIPENEPRANERDFDKTISTLLSAWGENTGFPGDAPRTLAEASVLFIQNPKLNDMSPIHFQGGAEYASGRFAHLATGRAMGKHREPPVRRYYLNPTADKMGHVVE